MNVDFILDRLLIPLSVITIGVFLYIYKEVRKKIEQKKESGTLMDVPHSWKQISLKRMPSHLKGLYILLGILIFLIWILTFLSGYSEQIARFF